jgi:hypothetical protein
MTFAGFDQERTAVSNGNSAMRRSLGGTAEGAL